MTDLRHSLLRLPAVLLAGVILALLGALVAPPSGARAATADDTSWSVRTASNDYGATRTRFAYTIDPGATVSDAMVVSNHGSEPLTLAVYAADGFTTDTGGIDLVVGGEESSHIGAWTQTDIDTVTVPAGETVEIPFTVTVPDAATPGDYAGGVVTSLGGSSGAEGIDADRRLGILMTVRVAGDLAPALVVDDAQLRWSGGLNPFAGGDAVISYTLRNAGNMTLTAQQTASAAGPFGWGETDAGEIEAAPSLLPGESWKVSVAISDVPALFWLTGSATVVPVVLDASGSTTALTPVTVTAVGWAVPWAVLVALVVLALLVVVLVRVRRRARATRRAQEEQRVQAAVDAALAHAAQDHDPAPVGVGAPE